MRKREITWGFGLSICMSLHVAVPAWAALYDTQDSSDVLLATITRWQHLPDGPELSVEELAMDPDMRARGRINSMEAAADMDRLFYLLEYGYCGYGYFSQEHSFRVARDEIGSDLSAREHWRASELAALVRTRLDFITDSHLRVGGVQFAQHQDFWFVSNLELTERNGTYYAVDAAGERTIVSVNGHNADEFCFRSLSAEGDETYILGTLSRTEPEPMLVGFAGGTMISERSYDLRRSSYKRSELFRRFELGGIPVVRIGTFSDHHTEEIDAFLASADDLRGEPCVIIDLRRNGGGNTRWPREWIRRFTGQTPDLNQTISEFVSRTALVGQSNYQAWLGAGPARAIRDRIEAGRERLATRIEAYDREGAKPYWMDPYVPERPRIHNETTLIVIVDREVASSGEGLISFLQNQVDNVVLVGENTMGALVFGHMTAHRLPNSGLLVQLPVKLNVALDLEFREERGFEPDYWVSSEDALNRAVAAVRAGTIPTVKPLHPEVFDAEFVPEKTPRFSRSEIRRLLLVVLVIVAPVIVGLVNRKRGAAFFILLASGLGVAGILGFAGNSPARVCALLMALGSGVVAGQKFRRARSH